MNYAEIKKLDEDTLKKLQEGTGPVDECLCSLLAPPEEDKRSIKSSIKKVLGKVKDSKGKESRGKEGKVKKPRGIVGQGQVIDIPLAITQAGNVKTTKEVIKHKGSCGKCGCDKDNFVLQHSYANIRITSPDISNFCPCPTHECLPEKEREKLKNNIKVTIERLAIDPDSENSESSIHKQKTILEPPLYTKSVSSLINAQYENEEDGLPEEDHTS